MYFIGLRSKISGKSEYFVIVKRYVNKVSNKNKMFQKKENIDELYCFFAFFATVILDGDLRKYTRARLLYDVNSVTHSKMAQDRCSFYSPFYNGKAARTIWYYQKDFQNDISVMRVLGAFGDILYNPAMLEDYDNTPFVIKDLIYTLNFTSQMFGVIADSKEFISDIMKVSRK